MIDQNGKITITEKFGYSLGDFASNLFWMTFVFFGTFFYTDIFGIPAAAVGTMFLVTKLWDSVNDPLMGMISDRTDTKWGKYRPYLLWIAVPFGVFGLAAFTTPNLSITGKIIYAYITYTAMMMAYTAINIPYSALMGVLTPNSDDRTSISSYRFIAAFAGGVFIQALTIPLMSFYGGGANNVVNIDMNPGHEIVITEKGAGNSQLKVNYEFTNDEGKTKKEYVDKIIWVNTAEMLSELNTDDGNLYYEKGFIQKTVTLPELFPDVDWNEVNYDVKLINQRKGFQMTMGTYALIAVILFLLTFKMTKERVHPPVNQQTTVGKDLKNLVLNVPWLILGVMSLFTLAQVCIRNGAIMYYFKYYVGNTVIATPFMVVGTAFNLVGVLCTAWLVKFFRSKKIVYAISLIGTGLTFMLYFFIQPNQVVLMFALQVVGGFLSGPQSPIVWAMYADTADYSEWRTGTRATGLFFSAATFAQKMGWTIGGALSGWLLAYFGFKANVVQSQETIGGIILLMSIIPAVASIIAGSMVYFYKLDNEFMHKIETDLKNRRKEAGDELAAEAA